MLLLKILGGIDLASALAFLMLSFGMNVVGQYLFFCAVLLLVKGLFIFKGEMLSAIDVVASFLLILSIFFTLPTLWLWIPSFLLVAKGLMSFL